MQKKKGGGKRRIILWKIWGSCGEEMGDLEIWYNYLNMT
jgi:hypothetical protein